MRNRFFIYSLLMIFALSQAWSCKKIEAVQEETNFRFSEKMTVDGRERTYILNLPTNYYTSKDFSLVIAMHGGGGDALQFESSTKLTEKAKTAQFIVVYPEGVKSTGILAARTWNAGNCCEYARDNNIDDVNFIRQLIDKLIGSYKINPKKVYATGHSNGGMMSYRLACELSNKIAAIAPNGCTMVVTQACNSVHPMPILQMQSELDTKVPYKGGSGSGVGTSGIIFPSMDSVLESWALKNACKTFPRSVTVNSNYTFTKWSFCGNNTTIQYYLTKDGGHAWPGGEAGSIIGDKPSVAISANDLLWDFFQQYQLP